jgi:hypothetical protein
MPWTPRDAYSHTKKASTPSTQQRWASVANSVLQSTGDEARAIREANATVAKAPRPSKRKRPSK